MTARSERALCALPPRLSGPVASGFRHLTLLTNHYPVTLAAFDKIVIFRIKIEPMIPADNRTLRLELMSQLERDLASFIHKPVLCGFTIYSHEEASAKEQTFTARRDKTTYSINVKQVKIIQTAQNPTLLLTFLNNGLRNQLDKMGYAEFGRSGKYFKSGKDQKEIDNLIIYNGFKANFVQLQSGFYLRVDSAKKVVRRQTVLNFLENFYRMHESKDRDDKRQLLKAELVDKIVVTNYGKMQYYRILDVKFDTKACEHILESQQNLLQYYRTKYNVRIEKENQPLLEVEGKRSQKNQGPVLLLPELCLMTGIPENFDEQRRKKISETSIKNPPEKVQEIGVLMNELKDSEEMKALAEAGIRIKKEMGTVEGRQIPVPPLLLGKEQCVERGKEASFNLFNKPIYSPKHKVFCVVLFFRGADISLLLQTFENTSRNLHVTMETRTQEVQGRTGKDLEKAMKSLGSEVNVCLMILPNNLKNDYKRLKQVATVDGMVTQAMTEFTLRKKNLQSVATKVLLQIIAKRGNTLWVPETPKELAGCMLMAFDTAKGREGTVLAATATINSTFSSLFATSRALQTTDDKFNAMKDLTLACVAAYSERNKAPPREVVVLLNACTGDQVSLYHELYFAPLTPKLQEAYRQPLPLTAVMVNVKNSERFFVSEGQVRNVPAGTLVNQGIVSKNYDFFLISQQSNRGSTVPNHYRVIYSSSKMEEGLLQQLIFSQCFNYVNWTGSIKVPAVLQYAKKCAKYVAEVMEKEEVAENIKGKPYFV